MLERTKHIPVVRLYLVFQFFFQLLIWIPIFYEFQKRIGLTDSEIFKIQSYYYILFCLLEIPTGLFADLLGYRRCLRLGSGIFVIANVMPIFISNYYGFFIQFALIALSRSFISGAASAYLYEYLRQNNQTHLYKKVEGDARAYALYGRILVWSVIGFLFQRWPESPYWLTAAGMSVAWFAAIALPDVKSPTNLQTDRRLISRISRHFQSSFADLIQVPKLKWVMVYGIGLFTLARLVEVNLFQPLLREKGIPVEFFGTILAAMTVFESIGAKFNSRIFNNPHPPVLLFWLTATACFLLSIALWIPTWTSIVVLCGIGFCFGVAYPIQRQFMNDSIPRSENRATLISIESILDRAVSAVAAAALGMALQQGKLQEFLSFTTIVVIFVLLISFPRLHSQK